MNPKAIVAGYTDDPKLLAEIDRFNDRLWALLRLEDEIARDRASNCHELARGTLSRWLGGPPVLIPTEYRELEARRIREELVQERLRLGQLCPIWGDLGGEPSMPVEVKP